MEVNGKNYQPINTIFLVNHREGENLGGNPESFRYLLKSKNLKKRKKSEKILTKI